MDAKGLSHPGSGSAVLCPQFHEFSAGGSGQFHVLHGHPFEQAMGIVRATEQVGSWQAPLGKARTIGATTHDLVIGLEAHSRKSFAGQIHRAHILT